MGEILSASGQSSSQTVQLWEISTFVILKTRWIKNWVACLNLSFDPVMQKKLNFQHPDDPHKLNYPMILSVHLFYLLHGETEWNPMK